MPKRGHGNDGAPRPSGPVASVRQAEDALQGVAGAGRATGTSPTGRPGGTPDGHPTLIRGDTEVRRSLQMENSAAAVLADRGYVVKQNPTADEVARAREATGDTGRPESHPDFLLEGRVFDCYSPTKPTKTPRGIWSSVEEKIVEDQTQRVVVNLADWRGDMSALRKQFDDWPIEGLKELKIITPDGGITQYFPSPASD